ncbi:HEAT repeat domain-containing protein [Streptomyces sp. NPDC091271]|uniref:HEAT repeat domain-containing protein n=1 Tax=Streptomyces sp. NPDC091271 TaxID=3365980 RepID=UPI0037F1C00F
MSARTACRVETRRRRPPAPAARGPCPAAGRPAAPPGAYGRLPGRGTALPASLRELVEVLPAERALREPLVVALGSEDPVVRATALDTLRALRLGDAELYARTLGDPDIGVRVHTVSALVSVDATDLLAGAVTDPSREVRVAVAKGLSATRSPGPEPLVPLLDDPDPLVRAAALAALAATGCPPAYAGTVVSALSDPAWQVRAGAATALSSAEPLPAVAALAGALGDPNADVRKAAVLALLHHTAHDAAREALGGDAHRPGRGRARVRGQRCAGQRRVTRSHVWAAMIASRRIR